MIKDNDSFMGRTEVPSETLLHPTWQEVATGRQPGNLLLDMEKHLAYASNAELLQFTVRKDRNGWVCILKVEIRERPFVTFINHDSFAECLETAAKWAYGDDCTFHPDKYPMERK